MNIQLTPQIIQQDLTHLATAQKNKHWIKADLSLGISSKLGRIFWCIIKHFDCLREFFYGVNLGKSKEKLHAMRAVILQGKDANQVALYNRAVAVFNGIVKKHKALEIKPADLVAPARVPPGKKMLDVAERIRVGAYNLLFPQPADDNAPFTTPIGYSVDDHGNVYENSDWRLNVIQKNIQQADLDVVCIQEVVDKSFDHLRNAFSNTYEIVWGAHSRKPGVHGVGILYNKHKFTLLNQAENFNLYPIPDAKNPGKSFNKPRKELVVDLQDKTTHKTFRIVSCHLLDPSDFADKGMHVRKVLEAAQKPAHYAIDRTIIAGDMNQDEWGDKGTPKAAAASENNATAFQSLIQSGFAVDGNYASTEYTKPADRTQIKDYNCSLISKNRHIDWIWASAFKPEAIALPGLDIRGSDHLLVASTII